MNHENPANQGSSGEHQLWCYKADQFYLGSNPLVKMMAQIGKGLGLLIGNREVGMVLATNRRIIYKSDGYFLWVFKNASATKTIYLDQVVGYDYSYQATFLVFLKSKILRINSTGDASTTFVFKKITEEGLVSEMDILGNAISQLRGISPPQINKRAA